MDLTRRRRDPMRSERGTAAVEFIGALPWMILAALVAWQLLLVGATASAVENAARSGSRAASAGGNGQQVATESLPAWLREGVAVEVTGTRVDVAVQVPIIAPLFRSDQFVVRRGAVFPP